ncbi:MAG: hypothetical protein KatS3mg131_0871 [Candidatus Tectimicrobiota bacterium]|nr:MAG: hypothetical protein KatS3mg131_0871 [Candidatus Tectomicrobia bacterium]
MHHGRKGIGSHKHGVSGTPGHNRDMVQLARELNREAQAWRRLRERQRGPVFDSVRALMQAYRRRA